MTAYEYYYDTPIEVTRGQYKFFLANFGGYIAHRKDSGRYWVKLWVVSKLTDFKWVLDNVK